MWRWRPEGWRENAAYFVFLVAVLWIVDVTTDWFGDGAVLAACVVIGAAGSAWLWYHRRRRANSQLRGS